MRTGDLQQIPITLYVHFPWCVRKCPYCDFNSHALRTDVPDQEYLEALIPDLRFELEHLNGRQITSIFFGGGTPSLMAASTISAVIETVNHAGQLSDNAEITLEANPGTIDAHRFAGYAIAGVNRLSIGVQSFNDRSLKALGRIHDSRQARKAYQAARTAGFENINIDLMFGLPDQSEREASTDLDSAIRLQPEHISYYQLTLEPNTLFHHDPPRLPDEDTRWNMQNQGLSRLRDNGWFRYEVSAFSRAGKQCRHNVNYWSFGDYVGVGAGAHGKLTDCDGVLRYSKPRHPRDYMSRRDSFRTGLRSPNKSECQFEFLLNALRLQEGFELAEYEQRTGQPGAELVNALATVLEQQLLKLENQRIRATEQGYWYLDEILQQFLPEESN